MPPFRGRGGRGGRGGFRGRRGRGPRVAQRDRFSSARVEDPVSEDGSENEVMNDYDSGLEPPSSEESSEEEEDSGPTVRPFNALLQAFEQEKPVEQPRRKKRKLAHEERQLARDESQEVDDDLQDNVTAQDDDLANEALDTAEVDDEEDLTDPFEVQFANPSENELSKKLDAVKEKLWRPSKHLLPGHGMVVAYHAGGPDQPSPASKRLVQGTEALKLKKKLQFPARRLLPKFSPLEQAIVPYVFDYQDLLFGGRTVQNCARLRQIVCLQALNHVFKTRDRVIKNNARISRDAQNDEEVEHRDQGFTRPKVLFLMETRQYCAKLVETMLSLCEPEQQENKKRFQDDFIRDEDKFSEDRPEDFRELFEGNDDNEFRLGIKFTRKTVKFFSQFYNSDIILASPLGLRRVIEAKGPKKKDYDFLSSIEMVVMDQSDAILMQNWEHVEFVFEHLNLHPKDLHGCDIGRVRSWYLDGHAAFLRQTIILSAYITPELNSLFNKHMRNTAGKVKYQPEYEGTILNISLPIKQTFSRYHSPTYVDDPDARFKYFTTAVVPSITRYPKPPDGAYGILIFIPSYLDYVRIRNYFANSQATQNISFGSIAEYSEPAEVRRARAHFLSGRHSVLLYTGRAHHFRRYNIKGVKRIVMFGLPENPVFYQELVAGYLGNSIDEGRLDAHEGVASVMFSKWDSLKLERVVGSKRTGSMLKEKGGDTFDFV